MSHDPSHWEAEVLKDQKKFQLTLSGHTHGFQIGIEIPDSSGVQFNTVTSNGLVCTAVMKII